MLDLAGNFANAVMGIVVFSGALVFFRPGNFWPLGNAVRHLNGAGRLIVVNEGRNRPDDQRNDNQAGPMKFSQAAKSAPTQAFHRIHYRHNGQDR